jgi:hypothetical protein
MKIKNLLFTTLLLAFGAVAPRPASAQGTTYLSNLGVATSGSVITYNTAWLGAQFTTGPNAYGFSLNSIRISIGGNQLGPTGGFALALYSDIGGKPGKQLTLLNGSSNPSAAGIYTYTATNFLLSGSTAYWVVTAPTTGNSTGYLLNYTASNAGYTATNGWSLFDTGHDISLNQGSTWSIGSGSPMQFAVNATELRPAFTSTGRYFQDFSAFTTGATNFGDGSQLFSTALGTVAAVQDDTLRELGLTKSGTPGVISAFELPDLTPGTPVYAFSMKWNSLIYGNFGNSSSGADGFSLNFGQLSSLNLTNGAVESGYGTGLSFDVQTYFGSNPGFYIRVNGNILAAKSYVPATQWGTLNGARHFFEADWNYYTGMTVRMDGQAIFSNVITPNFIPHAGDRFVWAARCGDLSEEIRLDNIVAMTGGNLVQMPATSPYYESPSPLPQSHLNTPASSAFDSNYGSYWNSYETGTDPWYVGATVLPARPAAAYVLTSSPDLGIGTGAPAAWSIDGSSNAGANWTRMLFGTATFNSSESRGFLLDTNNSTAFGAYRINVTLENPHMGDYLAIGELQFYGFNAVQPPPKLNAALSGGSIVISWSTNQGGLALQQNSNLASMNWLPVTNPTNIVNGQYQVTVPRSGTNNFFRLGLP